MSFSGTNFVEMGVYVRPNTATWQQSAVESNFSPIKLIPNVRVHPSLAVTSSPESVPRYEPTGRKLPLSPGEFEAMSVHERLYCTGRSSPSSLVDQIHNLSPDVLNGRCKFVDHRTNINTSPIKIRPSSALMPIVKDPRFGKVPQLQCGHESMVNLSPSKPLVTAYKTGLPVHCPLKIVTHQKRGVKLPKLSPEKPSNSVTRNHHGGYYSTMA
jgi:hypothetical protein